MFLIKDDFWQIKKTKEKGLGVFARKAIKKGTIVGDYLRNFSLLIILKFSPLLVLNF